MGGQKSKNEIKLVSPKKLSANSFSWDINVLPKEEFVEEIYPILYKGDHWWITFDSNTLDLKVCRLVEKGKPLTFQVSIESNVTGELWKSSEVEVGTPSDGEREVVQCAPWQTIPLSVITGLNLGASDEIKYILELSFILLQGKDRLDTSHSDQGIDNEAERKSDCIEENISGGNIGDPERMVEFYDLKDLSENIKEVLVRNEDDFDVTLTVKGTAIKAHKLILTARSPVFQRMFEQDMVEHRSGQVEITDCDAGAFREFLLYLYSGKVKITLDNAADLHHIADKYQSVKLSRHCVEFMKSHFTVEKFSDFVSVALTCAEVGLIEAATSYLARHFAEIIASGNWKAFIQENPLQANELISKAYKVEKG